MNSAASHTHGLRKSRSKDSEAKTAAVRATLDAMLRSGVLITKAEVMRRARVSKWFVYYGPGVLNMIETAQNQSAEYERFQDAGASIDTQRLVHRLGQMECEVERLVALIERLQLGWPLLYSFDDAQTSLGGIDRAALQSLLVGGELIQVNIGDMHYVTSRSLLAYIERLVAKGVA
jgi:hypothetical protein